MEEEEEFDRLKAITPPRTSKIASEIFSAIHSYSKGASIILSGMALSFQGLNKDYLVRNAKRFRNIDLTRYETYIDIYEQNLAKIYNKGNKNG